MRTRRLDALLTPSRLTAYPLILGVGGLLALVITSVLSPLPFPDFVARWTAGVLVRSGEASNLYDPVAQSQVQRGLGASRLSWFVSPPPVAAACAVLALLPYAVAAVAWVLASAAVVTAAARATAVRLAWGTPWRRRAVVVALAAQPTVELLGSGQDSAVVLLGAVGADVLHRRRPVLAGAFLGLSLVKPQLAFLVPVALLVLALRSDNGRRMLAGFCATALGLAAMGTVVVGPASWGRWLAALASPLFADEVATGQAWKSVDVLGLLSALSPVGLGAAARPLAVLLGAVGLGVALTAWRRRVPTWSDLAPSVWLLTVLISPHVMVYDTSGPHPHGHRAGDPAPRLVERPPSAGSPRLGVRPDLAQPGAPPAHRGDAVAAAHPRGPLGGPTPARPGASGCGGHAAYG